MLALEDCKMPNVIRLKNKKTMIKFVVSATMVDLYTDEKNCIVRK